MDQFEEIINYFPYSVRSILLEVKDKQQGLLPLLQEIRIRIQRPILLKTRGADAIVNYRISQSEILQTIERLCENSIYAYQNQICEGFLTIKGGHRIGITGSCIVENGKITNIKYISSLNFRIAREVKGCCQKILPQIIENNQVANTLIVSPPGKGKTTILRDLIRMISDGIPEYQFSGKTCGVVDERGEIAACFKGIPQNDIGIRTDVIENVSKAKGLRMLIRSMAPEVIACDEIGSQEDTEAIKQAFHSGVKGIFTMHGKNLEDIKSYSPINELIETHLIEKIIFLEG